jgi:hypothetical protein
MTTSLKVLAFGLLLLASPAFAHGGGNGHGMSQDMGHDVSHMTTMNQNDKKTPSDKTKRTDQTNARQDRVLSNVIAAGSKLIALYEQDLKNGNVTGQKTVLNQLQALSRFAARNGVGAQFLASNGTTISIGRRAGGKVIFAHS